MLRVLTASKGLGADAPFGRYSLESMVLAAVSWKGRKKSGDIMGHYGWSQELCGMRFKTSSAPPVSVATRHPFESNELRPSKVKVTCWSAAAPRLKPKNIHASPCALPVTLTKEKPPPGAQKKLSPHFGKMKHNLFFFFSLNPNS